MSQDRAIYAGEQALQSLEEARRQLSAAAGWGIIDLLGGRSFSGFVKHYKIAKAKETLEKARQDLYAFRTELSYLPAINIDIDGFLTFADFFFDGFLADIFVQSKINKAKADLDTAIYRVKTVLEDLRRQ